MASSNILRFQVVDNKQRWTSPKRGSLHSAGVDLYSDSDRDIRMEGHSTWIFATNLRVYIPEGYYGRIAPRSSLAKLGIMVNAGVIDSDYRGEIKIVLHNLWSGSVVLSPANPVAQLIVEKYHVFPEGLVVISQYTPLLDHTERGEGGFGSTNIPSSSTTNHEVSAETVRQMNQDNWHSMFGLCRGSCPKGGHTHQEFCDAMSNKQKTSDHELSHSCQDCGHPCKECGIHTTLRGLYCKKCIEHMFPIREELITLPSSPPPAPFQGTEIPRCNECGFGHIIEHGVSCPYPHRSVTPHPCSDCRRSTTMGGIYCPECRKRRTIVKPTVQGPLVGVELNPGPPQIIQVKNYVYFQTLDTKGWQPAYCLSQRAWRKELNAVSKRARQTQTYPVMRETKITLSDLSGEEAAGLGAPTSLTSYLKRDLRKKTVMKYRSSEHDILSPFGRGHTTCYMSVENQTWSCPECRYAESTW